MEPQLKDIVVELTAESALVAELPLAIYDLEGQILVRRSGMEAEQRKVLVVVAGSLYRLKINKFEMHKFGNKIKDQFIRTKKYCGVHDLSIRSG